MLENHSTNELFRLSVRGGWKQRSSPLHSAEGLSWGQGGTGIIRKAKGESNIQLFSPDTLRLAQTSHVLCPHTNSQRKFARSLE